MTTGRSPGGRVLVTGAAGFIGAALSQALLAAGHRVLGIDNLTPYYNPALKQARLDRLLASPGFTFCEVDIAAPGALMEAWSGFRPDAAVHLAAQAGVRWSLSHPHAYTHANVEGTLCVLEAARKNPVAHLLYASSSSVYGGNDKVPFAETHPVERPVSLYAATKRSCELMARTYAHLYGVASTGLRFFTVYGRWGRPDMAYWLFTDAILAGRPIEVFNHGRMARDMTHVDDIVGGIVRLLPLAPVAGAPGPGQPDGSVPHRVLNLGGDRPESLGDLIAAIETACGRPAERVFKGMQPGDVERTWADMSALRDLVGWSPGIRMADGVADFVEWYRGWNKG
ncbi:NAD-dependent epimerase/dehydratase family protein [Humitalea sp. 24SJ18S-53]|uniref:NAD-dependent epimerase/dehydratase family protein n=1 Tax=Humitalea sp. 24SJ18S-53 TaxID=3422307 RepID=UPI003D671942